jgi:membrane protein DedA with SNARE-associated domain
MLVAALSASQLSLPPVSAWLAVTIGATLGSMLSYHLGLLMTHSARFHRLTSRHEELCYAFAVNYSAMPLWCCLRPVLSLCCAISFRLRQECCA